MCQYDKNKIHIDLLTQFFSKCLYFFMVENKSWYSTFELDFQGFSTTNWVSIVCNLQSIKASIIVYCVQQPKLQ